MENSLIPIVFQSKNTSSENLEILGLTVHDRNQKLSQRAGFILSSNESLTDAKSPHLVLKADLLILPSGYAEIKNKIKNHLNQNHDFYDPLGLKLPLSFSAPEATHTERHVLITTIIDIETALLKSSETEVQKKGGDLLFKEIYDGTSGWIARSINKKISFFLTRYLVKTSITPNQITFINLLMGLCGAFCFLSTSFGVQCLGGVLLQLNSIVDGCDGEVARLKVQYSPLGGWYDTVADDILNNVMFLCLVLGLYFQNHDVFWLKAGLLSVAASLGVTALIYQNLLAQGLNNASEFKLSFQKKVPQSSQKNEKQKSIFEFLKPLLKRDFFIFVVFVAVLLNVRVLLIAFLLPVWGAFFLYLASFIYSKIRKKESETI